MVRRLRIEKNRNAQREKPKLDYECSKTERNLFFIDPDDEEYKEILKTARRNLERPMAPAMPCKRNQPSITKVVAKPNSASETNSKTMQSCLMESHESTRQRAESLQSRIHEDRITGKSFTSMTHYNMVHKFIPMPQAMKIPDTKAAVDKEWKKLESIPAWNLENLRAKRRLFWKHRKKHKVHVASVMDKCHLKNAELEPKFTEVQRQSRAPV